MALANFHERSATAASQILKNFDLQGFRRVLEKSPVAIALDATVAKSPEALIAADLTANLVARMYPRVELLALDVAAQRSCARLEKVLRRINPDIEILESDHAACTLVIGSTPIKKIRRPIYIGSDGWIAGLSRTGPITSGSSKNPFGAAASACFGVANVFRTIFSRSLPGGKLDDEIRVSLLDQVPQATKPANPSWKPVDIGETHLVGVGAIGNAFVWTLSRAGKLQGALHLIDHETVELSNLQRYVLTEQRDVDRAKVDVGAYALRDSGLKVHRHQKDWASYLAERQNWNLPQVAVALDTPDDRIVVQAALPKYIVNAWTQAGDLGNSRHGFIGKNACLACLYLPDKIARNRDQVVADALGLSGDDAVRDVRRRLQQDIPTDRPFLDAVATALGIAPSALVPFEGQPLQSFYAKAVCGGAIFKLSGGKKANPALVPMAFQSALAGVLLAAEIVAHSAGMRRPTQTKTTIDLLRPLAASLLQPRLKAREHVCICQDEDYIEVWRDKYER